jgi:hypothetical protein
MANLPGTSQQLYYSLQAYLGPPDYTHQTIIDIVSPTTFSAIIAQITNYEIAASTSYQSVNLSTIFPAVSNAIFLVVCDVTSPNQTFGISTVNGSGSITIAAITGTYGGFWCCTPNGGTLPTLYMSNPNSTPGLLQIGVFSN